MLLDLGADVTLIPSFVVDALSVSRNPEVQYEVTGFDGQIQ
jgi:hypothetical protein